MARRWTNPLSVVFTIAFNTYREAVRSKILYSILFFGLFLIAFSAALGEFSFYQNERVIKDVGLFALSTFGSLMAVFLGVSFVYKEIERKSIHNILSKPVRRWQYFLGKFLGIVATLYLQLILMFAVLCCILFFWIDRVPTNVAIAFLLICVEVTIVTTIALLFSSFSTPYLSGFMTLGAFLIGKGGAFILRFAEGKEGFLLNALLNLADRVAPALYVFDISSQVTYDLRVTASFIFHAVGYGFCYSAIVLMMGMLIFSRRDFI